MKSFLSGFLGGIVAIAAAYILFVYWESSRSSERDLEFDQSWAKQELSELVLKIERYKLIFGNYPETLKKARNGFSGFDQGARECDCVSDYYYELNESNSSYLLLSKGLDCMPKTNDDLYPEFTESELKNIGLRILARNLSASTKYECNDV